MFKTSKTQCHSISMLISDDLHLNVPSTLAELHHEDRRAWNFILNLDEASVQSVQSASKNPSQDLPPPSKIIEDSWPPGNLSSETWNRVQYLTVFCTVRQYRSMLLESQLFSVRQAAALQIFLLLHHSDPFSSSTSAADTFSSPYPNGIGQVMYSNLRVDTTPKAKLNWLEFPCAFGGFDHHRESNAFDCFLGLLHCTHSAFPKNVLDCKLPMAANYKIKWTN